MMDKRLKDGITGEIREYSYSSPYHSQFILVKLNSSVMTTYHMDLFVCKQAVLGPNIFLKLNATRKAPCSDYDGKFTRDH